MNANNMTALVEEYVKTSPAPGLPCIRIGQESISPVQALEKMQERTDDSESVFREMAPHLKQFLKTNLI